MNQKTNQQIDLAQADALLKRWRSRHNTPEKVAASHRKVLLERVSQSMSFEGQPVSTDRLKALTSTPKPETC